VRERRERVLHPGPDFSGCNSSIHAQVVYSTNEAENSPALQEHIAGIRAGLLHNQVTGRHHQAEFPRRNRQFDLAHIFSQDFNSGFVGWPEEIYKLSISQKRATKTGPGIPCRQGKNGQKRCRDFCRDTPSKWRVFLGSPYTPPRRVGCYNDIKTSKIGQYRALPSKAGF
jgi:hypothetical protein